MACNRGIYHDGWYACTTPFAAPWLLATGKLPDVNDYQWELYNVAVDYSQNHDLKEQFPEKLKELQALFVTEAEKYQVFPLDNRAFVRLLNAATQAPLRERPSSPTQVKRPASPSPMRPPSSTRITPSQPRSPSPKAARRA
jgi:hypothetical protein